MGLVGPCMEVELQRSAIGPGAKATPYISIAHQPEPSWTFGDRRGSDPLACQAARGTQRATACDTVGNTVAQAVPLTCRADGQIMCAPLAGRRRILGGPQLYTRLYTHTHTRLVRCQRARCAAAKGMHRAPLKPSLQAPAVPPGPRGHAPLALPPVPQVRDGTALQPGAGHPTGNLCAPEPSQSLKTRAHLKPPL